MWMDSEGDMPWCGQHTEQGKGKSTDMQVSIVQDSTPYQGPWENC